MRISAAAAAAAAAVVAAAISPTPTAATAASGYKPVAARLHFFHAFAQSTDVLKEREGTVKATLLMLPVRTAKRECNFFQSSQDSFNSAMKTFVANHSCC